MKRVGLCFVGLRMALVSLCLLVKIFIYGQIRWDGEAGDGLWSNPQNWTGDNLPGSADDVILDHTYLHTTYKINLPSGTTTVTIHSLQIIPALPDSIYVELPVSNTISPGLQITGSGYPLIIGDRGVLINASGSASGASLTVSDSIRISNGGKYIHRTPRAHAALVTFLSRSPGTEEGIFCFDVPDVSSTISLSDRTFGKLQLMAAAAGGNLNYTAAATKKIRVRSDLIIEKGVKLNLNCTDTLQVVRDLIQLGGVLNLSTSTRVLVLSVGGSVQVASGSIITESGSVSATLLLNGNASQEITAEGQISNQVSIVLSNSAGYHLNAALSVPYMVELKKGRLLTNAASPLVISSAGMLRADSLNLAAFIEGPVRLEGLNAAATRLVPVGAANELRWISVQQATGNFTVEYRRSDPRLIDNRVTGLHHISSKEYWSVQTDGNAQARIELSFNDANQSGITDMNSLHVARLESIGWIDAGHSAFTGSAGGRGSVISELQSLGQSGEVLFTLGSTEAQQNPLPLHLAGIRVLAAGGYDRVLFPIDSTIGSIEMQQRMKDGHFEPMKILAAENQASNPWKEFRVESSSEDRICRLVFTLKDSGMYVSPEFFIRGRNLPDLILGSIAVRSNLIDLQITSKRSQRIRVTVYDALGRTRSTQWVNLISGRQIVPLPVPGIASQVWIVQVMDGRGGVKVVKVWSWR